MKITLQNANSPFVGSVIDICNLVAGVERFRIQVVPLLGRILWDGDKQVEVERPFDGGKLFLETGISVELHWFEAGRGGEQAEYPKHLGKIFIGSKWTGPLFMIDVERGKTFALFGRGNHGKSYASGGTWSYTCTLMDTSRETTPEEREAGKGLQTREGTPADGFDTLSAALVYRFCRDSLEKNGKDRLFGESLELHEHIRTVLSDLGLL